MRGNKVIKAGIGYTLGNILIRGVGFISIPIFTRLMSTEDYGLYNTYAAYESILYLIIGLTLNSSVKSAKLEFQEKFDEYISSISTLVIVNTGLWLIVTNIIYPLLYGYIWEYNRAILNVLVLHSGASALLVIYNAAVSVRFQYRDYLKIATLNSVGGVVLSIILIKFVFRNCTYLGRILGVVSALCITSILILRYFFKKAKPAKPIISKKYCKFALNFSLPVVPHGVAQVLLSQFDRIMIKSMVGASEAGIYSFAGNISSIMKVITSSIETAWSPWFFEEYSKGNKKKIVQVTHYLVVGFSLFTSSVMLCMPELLKFMAPSDYWDGIKLVVPMSLDVFCTFLYTVYVQVEYYYKKTHYLMFGTVMTAIINVVLNSLMIPRYGYVIAAYTTLISYVCYFLFHYYLARRIAGEDVMNIGKSTLEILICIFVAVFATVFRDKWYIRWILAVIMCISAVVIFGPKLRLMKRGTEQNEKNV